MFANTLKWGTANMKQNVDINTLIKSVKLNHAIKDAKTDISKYAGMAKVVKE